MSFTADRLLLFGATGDLAQRMLLPSLCALHADGLVAEDLQIVGTARQQLDDASFRNFAREALEKFMPADRRGAYADNADALTPLVCDAVQPGDVVMIKGSLGSRMGPLVEAIRAAHPPLAKET